MLDKAARMHDIDLGAVAVISDVGRRCTTTRAGCRSCASSGLAPEQLAAIKFDVRVPQY